MADDERSTLEWSGSDQETGRGTDLPSSAQGADVPSLGRSRLVIAGVVLAFLVVAGIAFFTLARFG